MINLIRNENMKLYSQRSTQVMLLLLIIYVIISGIIVKIGSEQNTPNPDWKKDLTNYNQFLRDEIEKKPDLKESYTKEITLNIYRINHNYAPKSDDNIWDFVKDISGHITIASILTIIVAASIITNEYKWGTIKNLLIRPYSRTQILLSKYISILLFAILLYVMLFIISWFVGGILFGFQGLNQPFLLYDYGKIKEINMIVYVLIQYGLDGVSLVMMTTLAFMISSLFKNSNIAVGLSIFLLFAGNAISNFFGQSTITKYLLFTNLDLEGYFFGDPPISGATLQGSVVIILTYYLVFITLTWINFVKRDIEV